MKRRTKDVLKQHLNDQTRASRADAPKSNGFQIVQRNIEKIEAEFTSSERTFYERLEQRTDRSLAQMMSGNALSYASALVLLLRLRQACNHPQLLKSDLTKENESPQGSGSGVQTPRKSNSYHHQLEGRNARHLQNVPTHSSSRAEVSGTPPYGLCKRPT